MYVYLFEHRRRLLISASSPLDYDYVLARAPDDMICTRDSIIQREEGTDMNTQRPNAMMIAVANPRPASLPRAPDPESKTYTRLSM